jgi:hypothetical protein
MPIEVRRELNERILAEGFGDYTGLAEEFTRRGYRISKSALHRYGQRLAKLARETDRESFVERLRAVPDNGLPMTVITIVDLHTGAARVLTTPNPITDVVGLLDPLGGAQREAGK